MPAEAYLFIYEKSRPPSREEVLGIERRYREGIKIC